MVESNVNSSLFFISQHQEHCGFIPVWRGGTFDQIVVAYLPIPRISSANFDWYLHIQIEQAILYL